MEPPKPKGFGQFDNLMRKLVKLSPNAGSPTPVPKPPGPPRAPRPRCTCGHSYGDHVPLGGKTGSPPCCIGLLNELRHVYDIGGIVIRLHRPGVGPANEEEARTIAEIDLQYPHLPQVVNDGTIQDAAEKVRGILYGQAVECS